MAMEARQRCLRPVRHRCVPLKPAIIRLTIPGLALVRRSQPVAVWEPAAVEAVSLLRAAEWLLAAEAEAAQQWVAVAPVAVKLSTRRVLFSLILFGIAF